MEYIVARRLTYTDIDVLSDGLLAGGDLDPHEHIPLSGNRAMIDRLRDGLIWTSTPSGKSERTMLPLAAVPGHESDYPARSIEVFNQGGKRREIKLSKQRHAGVELWKEAVKANLPAEDTAYILLIRDSAGEVHARYLPNLDDVPGQLRHRLAAGKTTQAHEFEGGLVLEDPLLARILQAVGSKHNVILYGPPGTGKTYLMLQAQQAFKQGVVNILFDPRDLDKPFKESNASAITTRQHRHSEFVTFHASTSYETFVVGLRPELVGGGLNYKAVAGPFLELAELSAGADSAALMLIDEINRGSTAEIFGELLTVLELDKRTDESGSAVPDRTVEVRFPYVPTDGTWSTLVNGRFRMPWHFYLLGSMNSVDRTVAPLDSALRRRFQIIEVPPDMTRLRIEAEKAVESLPDLDQPEFMALARLAHDVLAALNIHIAVKRGPDFRLGHSYFWPVVKQGSNLQERREAVLRAFGDSILPQLVELLRDRPEELAAALGGEANQDLLYRYHRDATTGVFEDRGWVEVLAFPGSLTEQEALGVLEQIAEMAGTESWATDGADGEEGDEDDGTSDDGDDSSAEDSEEA